MLHEFRLTRGPGMPVVEDRTPVASGWFHRTQRASSNSVRTAATSMVSASPAALSRSLAGTLTPAVIPMVRGRMVQSVNSGAWLPNGWRGPPVEPLE